MTSALQPMTPTAAPPRCPHCGRRILDEPTDDGAHLPCVAMVRAGATRDDIVDARAWWEESQLMGRWAQIEGAAD